MSEDFASAGLGWGGGGPVIRPCLLQKHPVCALVMRAFGNMLAEVPLIATRLDARRKGHARYLMTALEDLLAQVTTSMIPPAPTSCTQSWTYLPFQEREKEMARWLIIGELISPAGRCRVYR
jgi:hypothetical protein